MSSTLNKANFKVVIGGAELEGIDYGSVHLDHIQEADASVLAFEVSRDTSIRKGDPIKAFYNDSLELEGEVAKVTRTPKCLKILASTIKAKDLPDTKKGFTFVNNWGTGALIVLAFIANKQAGVGIILCNFGFYIGNKMVDKKKAKK